MEQEKNMTGEESLQLITTMINRAKDSFHDSGVGAIMWGALIAVCSLEKCAEIHFGYRLPVDIFLLTLAAIIPQIIISMKEAKQRKVKSYNDVAMDYIWMGFGICIFLLSHTNFHIQQEVSQMAQDYRQLSGGKAPGFRFWEYSTSFFLILYGLPTFATGGIMKFKPMLWGGLIFWACAVIVVYTPVKIDLLLMALSAITGWLIPGLILNKAYRGMKRKAANNYV
jgi:hypothetical protein